MGEAESEQEREPYSPFPAFEDFASASLFDPALFDPFAENFATLKEQVEQPALERAVRTATRWAAVDTGAIEGLYDVDRGFTYTVAASASALDNAHLAKGQDVQNNINDAIAAYEYVLDVATREVPPTEKWVKDLHAKICASQRTHRVLTPGGWQDQGLPKGEYKKQPNNPMNLGTGRVHEYAPPDDTPAEMARLLEELRSQAFESAHPVLQAAYSHYAFVCVHPFADGNGRVSRALASTFLYRSPGIPLVIFADQKGAYIQALELADRGDPSQFVAFIRDCALDIMSMVGEDVRRPEVPEPTERIQALKRALVTPQGVTHQEMDALSVRINEEWRSALATAIQQAGIEAPINVTVQQSSSTPGRLPDFRQSAARPVLLHGRSEPPAQAERKMGYSVRIPVAGSSTVDFVLFKQSNSLTDIALREVHPAPTTAFRYRLQVLADAELREFIDELATSAETYLAKHGFNQPGA